MAIKVTPVPFSMPIAGYGYDITVLDHIDGTTANALTLTGLSISNPPFVPNGLLIQCISSSAAAATPQASYASYDAASLILDPNDPSQATVNVYVKDTTTGSATKLRLFLY